MQGASWLEHSWIYQRKDWSISVMDVLSLKLDQVYFPLKGEGE